MCLLCDGGPIDGDPRPTGKAFKTDLLHAPCRDPLCCLGSCICPCPAACIVRKKALDGDMSKYICCQGYYGSCCCFRPGKCGEQSCPNFCLCIEAFCCESCAISATRMYVMDQNNIQSDPMDRKIIRCNNCLQMFSCICSILAAISGNKDCADIARCIRCIAQITYCTIQACMSAQVNYELESPSDGLAKGPAPQTME